MRWLRCVQPPCKHRGKLAGRLIEGTVQGQGNLCKDGPEDACGLTACLLPRCARQRGKKRKRSRCSRCRARCAPRAGAHMPEFHCVD